jgi:hypothetical protein
VGEIHRGHATAPQLTLEPVTISQGVLKLFHEVWH